MWDFVIFVFFGVHSILYASTFKCYTYYLVISEGTPGAHNVDLEHKSPQLCKVRMYVHTICAVRAAQCNNEESP